MHQYQRILLIADPSMQRTAAFYRAERLAKTSGATLHIAIFDRSDAISAIARVNPKAADHARESWLGQRRLWLSEEAMILHAHGLMITTEVVWSHPTFDAMSKSIADYHPDLVVKDVQRESAFKRMLFKQLDWRLMSDCATPIMLVSTPENTVSRHVIAAVDVSNGIVEPDDFNCRVIKEARKLSRQCTAELHLAYAFNLDLNEIKETASYFSEEDYHRLRDIHLKTFYKLMELQKIPIKCAHFLYGAPADTLADFTANDSSDVLVVGTHQRHGLNRLFMGSSADAILDRATCDLLVVKPGEMA